MTALTELKKVQSLKKEKQPDFKSSDAHVSNVACTQSMKKREWCSDDDYHYRGFILGYN